MRLIASGARDVRPPCRQNTLRTLRVVSVPEANGSVTTVIRPSLIFAPKITRMKRLVVFSCALALMSVHACAQRLEDSSDWWSISREDPRTPNVKPSHHELQSSNFSLAGVTLGHGGFEAIKARLGRAPEIERGDASTGRDQVCYASAANSAVRVVFEFGEDESIFYIFAGGAPWTGSKYCVPSKRVSDRLSTASGIRLGLTRSEVEAILGPPDTTTSDEFVYSREFNKKSTPTEFETFRKDYPQRLSDEEAHREFDFYPVEQYILVRFKDSKLIYLSVSVSGSGD
jgi:hypothetical protein